MLTPGERAALVVRCVDHSVATCPHCGEVVTASRIGADLVLGRRDFCPACRTDLTAELRQHLTTCLLVRAEAAEAFGAASSARDAARETVKTSQQLCDEADLLTREAENATERSRRIKRGLDRDEP